MRLRAFASAALLLASCQRKAPGPDECVAFARVWVQQDKVSLRQAMVGADAFDELVLRCLTTPFDRALVDLNEAVRRNTRDHHVYWARGVAFRHKGSYEQSIADLTEAIRINPRRSLCLTARSRY